MLFALWINNHITEWIFIDYPQKNDNSDVVALILFHRTLNHSPGIGRDGGKKAESRWLIKATKKGWEGVCYLHKEGIKPGVLCQTSVLASHPCGDWTILSSGIAASGRTDAADPGCAWEYCKPDETCEKALLLNTKKKYKKEKKSPGMVSAVNLRTNRADVAVRVHRHGN